MNKSPIIIIDDDPEDLEMLEQIFNELKVENEIIIFDNGLKFLEYMRTTHKRTFFILCDVQLGIINGLELKRKIYEDSNLCKKCIPFILFSTSKASAQIFEAYSFGVQGYFVKPNSFQEYRDMIHAIMVYWTLSEHPNS